MACSKDGAAEQGSDYACALFLRVGLLFPFIISASYKKDTLFDSPLS